jgi:hypothetical protein
MNHLVNFLGYLFYEGVYMSNIITAWHNFRLFVQNAQHTG